MQKRRYIIGLLILTLVVTECWLQTRLTWKKEERRLGYFAAHRHYNPAPPEGKWAAIYTADFARKFNLPPKGISTELGNNIEYIEAVSIEGRKLKSPDAESYPDQDCAINFIFNKDSDIPLYEGYPLNERINKARRIDGQKNQINAHMKNISKPLQFLNINNKYDATFRSIFALDSIHSSDVLPGYDYLSTKDFRCISFLRSIRENRDISYDHRSFLKTSIVNKHAHKFFQERIVVIDKKDEEKSFIRISVPKMLAVFLYEGTDIPREPTYAILESVIDIPKAAVASIFVAMFALAGAGAPDKSDFEQEPRRVGLPAPWPPNTPTHFKLDKNYREAVIEPSKFEAETNYQELGNE